MSDPMPTLAQVFAARKRIRDLALRTPLIPCPALTELTGVEVHLKPESLQPTGSFKIRGAANKILSLTAEERERGVIAFSTGNHGRAVAHVCRELGFRAVICLSERVPAFRVEAMAALGAEVVRHGQSQDEAYQRALEIQADQGLTMVAPFDDPEIIAGQGTICLEIMEDLPEAAGLVVPVSGGGLMAGLALAAKSIDPGIRTMGVSMEVAPAMYRSLEAGRPLEIPEKDSLADALLGGIGLDNRFTFPLVRDLVDEMALVSEEEIARGMVFCLARLGLVVEGSGAVGVAALVSGRLKVEKGPLVLVLSGGNANLSWLITEAAQRRAGSA